mmetsp:Transcript_5319/g.15154  ORF Transcript_5319/g.15154 Transcript_5319/m.15154 type:complete len:282 (+) Transcript_5319:441-1286(+)
MNRLAFDAHSLEGSRELVAHALCRRKDQHLPSGTAQIVEELPLLVPTVPAYHNLLVDVWICLQLVRVAHPDLNGVSEEIGGHPTYLLGPRGREHHRLPVRWNLGDHLPDLRFEAHIQHPVRLVENEKLHTMERDAPALDEVIQTAWRSRQNVRLPPEVRQLRPFWCAPISESCGHTSWAAELLGVRVNLTGQLACRSHHKHARRASWSFSQHPSETGEQETEGLSRTRFRDADEISASCKDGPRVRLNDRRTREARLHHGIDEELWQSDFVPPFPRWWYLP